MNEIEFDYVLSVKKISKLNIVMRVPVEDPKQPPSKKLDTEKTYKDVRVQIEIPQNRSEEELSSENDRIIEWITDNDFPSKYDWMKEISNIKKIENPLRSEIVFLTQSKVYKLFSESCNVFQIPKGLIDERQKIIPKDRVLEFMDEIKSADKISFNKDLVGHSLSSYFLDNDEFEKPNTMNVLPPPKLLPLKLIRFKLKEFSSKFKLLSPIQFTAKLLDEKKFISEEWTFYPNDNISIYQKSFPSFAFDTKEEASFVLPDTVKNVFFVVILSHILCVDGSAMLSDYYITGNKEKAKKELSTTWPRNHDVFTPFGFAFVQLSSALEKREIVMSRIYPLNQHPTASNITQLIGSGLRIKSNSNIKMKLVFETQRDEAINPVLDLATSESNLIRLFQESPNMIYPRVRLTHLVRINLIHAAFDLPKSIKGRNIFAIVSIRNDTSAEPLKLHHSRFLKEKDFLGISKCYYHSEKGVFNEIFSFNLPYPLSEKMCLCIEYYHLIAKKCDSDTDRQYIGCSYIKLITKEIKRITDGIYKLPIYYKKLKDIKISSQPLSDSTNQTAVDIRFDSSFIFPDKNFANFVRTSDPKAVIDANKDDLAQYFYLTLDILVDQLSYKPKEAIAGFVSVVKKVKRIFKERTNIFLSAYASTFSLRSPNEKCHIYLMNELADFLFEFPYDKQIFNIDLQKFFFIIILKSVILSSIESNSNNLNASVFTKFCISLTYSIMKTEDPINSIISYSNFLVSLFNINYCSQVIYALLFQLDTMVACNSPYIELFLKEILKPKLLYCSIMNIPTFIECFIKKYINLKTKVPFIFTLLIDLFSLYPIEIQHEIGLKLVELISEMSPLKWIKNDPFNSEIIFFIFLIENIQFTEETIKWWRSSNKDSIIRSLNSLIKHINISSDSVLSEQSKNKEIAFSVNCAVFNFIKFLEKDKESLRYTISIIYTLISNYQSLEVNIYKNILNILTNLTVNDTTYFMCNLSITSTTFFKCLLLQSSKTKMISRYFSNAFSAGYAIIAPSLYRVLSEFTIDELQKINLVKVDSEQDNEHYNVLLRDIPRIIEIEKEFEKSELSIEDINILLMEKINIFHNSPDSIIEILIKLENHLNEHEYYAELLQTKISHVAIIIEYLTLQKRIPMIFNTIHPSTVFKGICNLHEFVKYDNDEFYQISGICDKKYFNVCSLNTLLYEIVSNSFQSKQFEVGLLMLNIAWPIFEYTRSYNLISKLMKMEKEIIDLNQKTTDRVSDSFFKVSFYGKCFGKLYDGKSFIYHEKSIVHLYEFSNNMISKWKENCPGIDIELIKEKGEIDKRNLDSNKGYIQIVFVEPYFSKKEMNERTTLFYKNNFIQRFFADVPFLKDSNKTQGNIDEQWIRRMIYNVKYPMPCIVKIQDISNIEIKEYHPIKVSYKQLQDRLAQFDKAVQESDCQDIQQLLHGTLLVQVNAGPIKIAELFLSNNSDDPKYRKYQAKLRDTFKIMETKVQAALEIHRKWVFQDQSIFRPLQEQLESGFTDFKDKLSNYY